MRSSNRATETQQVMLYLLILLAFILRVYHLGLQSIWWDEGFSVQLARLSVPEAVRFTARDIHPPLYYILLHYWVALTGDTEFSLRFLSLVFGVLLVACAYAFGRRFFDARTALLSAALVTLAPLEVIYSQEARMYTLLTLEYLTVLWIFYLLIGEGRVLTGKEWAILILAEAASLYTHYFGVLILGSVNLLAGAYLALGRRWRNLGLWIGAQVLALALYIPWMWIATRQLVAYVPMWVEPRGLVDFTRTTWHASVLGRGEVIGTHMAAIQVSRAFGLCLLTTLALALWTDRRRDQTALMLLLFILPMAVAFGLERLRPNIAARHLMAFYLVLFFLASRGISVLTAEEPLRLKLVGLMLGLAFISVSAVGLRIQYFDERYHHDDVRSMAAYLEEQSTEEDVIISDYHDFPELRYYYGGSTAIHFMDMIGPEPPLVSSLAEATQGKDRVFFVKWMAVQTDWRDIIPFYLELGGPLTERRDFRGFTVLTYQLERPFQMPELEPLFADFGLFRLTGAFVEQDVIADDAITLALRWKLTAQTPKDYKAALSLWDERGHLISAADSFFLDEACYTAKRWPAGREITNFYVLPIPPGTPPITYTLLLGIYEEGYAEGLDLLSEAGTASGKRFQLGEVSLAKPRTFPAKSGYRFMQSTDFQLLQAEVAEGLALQDFRLSHRILSPGGGLGIQLKWRATRDGLPEYSPELRVVQGNNIVASAAGAPAYGLYPTNLWSPQEDVFDWRDLTINPDTQDGPARLEVRVGKGNWIPLAELTVSGPERTYQAPDIKYRLNERFGDFAELLGYDLVQAKDARSVEVTLYWRAINEAPIRTSYKVFTHLLDETGRLVGQHDGMPSMEKRPTTSWLKNEIVIDRHQIPLNRDVRMDSAIVEIGLYDPVSLERVLTASGRDNLVLPRFQAPRIRYPVGARFGDVAELLGYDLSSAETTTRDGVDLTLYWRALRREAPPVAYTAFTHLLSPEVRVVAQHDGPPAGGLRPTTGWVQGEVIVDRHHLEFREPDFQGQASIEVGLYDPATGNRLTLEDGQDHLLLPTPITVRAGK